MPLRSKLAECSNSSCSTRAGKEIESVDAELPTEGKGVRRTKAKNLHPKHRAVQN